MTRSCTVVTVAMSGNVLSSTASAYGRRDPGHRVPGDHHLVAEVDRLDGQSEHAQVDRHPGGHHRLARPRLRSQVSSEVPVNGETPCSRDETRSPGSGPSSCDELGRRRARQQVVGVAQHGGDQLAVDRRAGPVGPELGRAVDDRHAPAPGPRVSSRAVFGTTPASSAASASWGKELRSPTTPRWISMVRTAHRPGAASSLSSTGTDSVP